MSMQIVMELAVGDLKNYYKGKLDKEMERPYSDAEGLVAWVLPDRLFFSHAWKEKILMSFPFPTCPTLSPSDFANRQSTHGELRILFASSRQGHQLIFLVCNLPTTLGKRWDGLHP